MDGVFNGGVAGGVGKRGGGLLWRKRTLGRTYFEVLRKRVAINFLRALFNRTALSV